MINLSTGAFFERATRQIGSLRSEAGKLQEQLGSGKRLTRSSDDPVAAARLRTLARHERLSEVDQRNSERAMADLKMTDKALGTMTDLVIRAQELTMQAANGANGLEQRQLLHAEIQGVRDSLLMVANSRNAAGQALFGGHLATSAYNPAGAYEGAGEAETVEIGDGQTVIRGLTGPEVMSFEHNGNPTDLLTVLGTLAAALQDPAANHTTAAQTALGELEAGLKQVTTAQTIVGARMGWIEIVDERRTATGELFAEERGEIGGADPATTMVRLQEMMTVLEASQASFVRLSGLSLFDKLR